MSFLNYSYGFLFFIFHLLFLFISFWFFMSGPLLFSFDLMEYCGEMINLVFLFDWVSFLFLSMVSLITGTVIFYSVFYMGNLSSLRFFFLLLLFVISMFFLIFSGNLIFMMLGWDGLGVTSFALVIYYQNEVSIKSGLVTIFINRLGDAAMVFFICTYFCLSMNYQVLSVESNWNLGVFLFLLGCFTKSAQFPFMSWLPAAMTAPTPISSLVHSSTLVTAGVYLLIRMNILFYLADMFFITKILGLITMGSGGMLALMEPDFKKIVAFSTLSQLGMMVFVVSYGEWQLGFFHLLTHAIFKSFLFMVVGCVMSLGYGNQDSRLMGVGLWSYWIFYIFIGFACLNLSGFPLTMGFLSKDVILELFLLDKSEMFIFSMFILFCCFTVAYSLKIFFMIPGIMKMGNPMVLNVKFGGELLGLLMLFFFMILWGLSLEEMVIFDDMFAGNQDVKIVDFFIIIFGFFVWLFMKSYLKNNLSYSLVDFFWIGWIFMQLGVMYKSLSLFLNHVSFSFLNFSFVQMFLYQFGSGVSLNSYDSKMNVTLSLRNFMISSFIFLNIIYFVFFTLLY